MNPQNRRIRLGIKQLKENPWIDFQKRNPAGTIIKGEVIRKTEFGVFVKAEEGIEGLLHKNDLSGSREEC